MWHSSKSIIFVTIISMEIIHGLHAMSISIYPEKFEENLNIYLGEPMDKCDNQKDENVQLVNMGLSSVTENFITSVNVKSINLEDNNIVYISPNAFKAVPNLSCLNIRRNNVNNIFNVFLKSFNHTLLNKLNLAQSIFKKTSSEDFSFEILDRSITTKNIEASSKMYLPYVTHLDLSDNNLEALPEYIKTSFPRLTHLYLSDNNLRSFNFIPPTTEYLYLERNRAYVDLTIFPKNINGLFLNDNKFNNFMKNYENLRILSIRNCSDVLYYIKYLNKGKLVDLDISSNRLNDIQINFFRDAKYLKRLSLDRNSLSSLSFLTHLVSLTNLSIAYNKLINIKSDFFVNLKNLQTLNLRGNRIENIDKDAFLNLRMLEKLDLAENNLSTLPVTWMNTLTGLRYLNLKSNSFSSIDSTSIYAYSNLNQLFLGNNNFIQIDMESLMKLPSTVIVHVSSINNSTCVT
ncbi:PREDICTED: toll-like receptor 13 [Polistes dominula]|uniref:Toll-like receptor 13 n=1 Tax=Polistes dominula TaxID=743375 RepID=A0ABM1IH02_POLDO|nr:PREDICTED: toll-like receptor 13 [Polistes dominula]